ncbi:unnamed protein product [Notodromas monacha]|uniref:ER-bound oxygenase mpaB/mpaB'/Rubber oxygenase catalytic domain-containing protein n=1 Tax=Notodromas monacha TaxID=399045 RepID=A0A7R9G8R1_9CRUS|nr:unnamed protein product [Notodromas monacha]CAG0912363.1 unnamed protein product [Notodromas monacha]
MSLNCPKKFSENELSSMRRELSVLLEGMREDVDYETFPPVPPWFDAEKFNKGRRFFLDNSFSIMFSHFTFLLIGMTVQRFVRVLVLTGRSSTPDSAFKRYMKTAMFLEKWYRGEDFWDETSAAHATLVAVRRYHRLANELVSRKKPVEMNAKAPVEGDEYSAAAQETLDRILRDIRHLPLVDEEFSNRLLKKDASVWREFPIVSQFDLSLTLLGFTGGILLCPEYFGIPLQSDMDHEGLDGFVFFWRTVAYCLGVSDEYNICRDSFRAARVSAVAMTELYVRPLLKRCKIDSLYMADAIGLGHQKNLSRFFPSARVMLCFGGNCPGVNVDLVQVRKSFTWNEAFQYYYLVFVFKYVMRFKLTRWMLQKTFSLAGALYRSFSGR